MCVYTTWLHETNYYTNIFAYMYVHTQLITCITCIFIHVASRMSQVKCVILPRVSSWTNNRYISDIQEHEIMSDKTVQLWHTYRLRGVEILRRLLDILTSCLSCSPYTLYIVYFQFTGHSQKSDHKTFQLQHTFVHVPTNSGTWKYGANCQTCWSSLDLKLCLQSKSLTWNMSIQHPIIVVLQSVFLISSYGGPLAQRALYLALHSSFFGPDGAVTYDIITNSINSLLISSRCIPKGAHNNHCWRKLTHAWNLINNSTCVASIVIEFN